MTDTGSDASRMQEARFAAFRAEMQAGLSRVENQIELVGQRVSREIVLAGERARSDITCWLDLLIGMVAIAVITLIAVLLVGGMEHHH